MRFKYVGDNNEPPLETTVFGYKFKLNGRYVNVDDPFAAKKLSGNKCFIIHKSDEIEDADFEEIEEPAEEQIDLVEVINGDSGGSKEESSN